MQEENRSATLIQLFSQRNNEVSCSRCESYRSRDGQDRGSNDQLSCISQLHLSLFEILQQTDNDTLQSVLPSLMNQRVTVQLSHTLITYVTGAKYIYPHRHRPY